MTTANPIQPLPVGALLSIPPEFAGPPRYPGLTFQELRETNQLRLKRWHGEPGEHDWNVADWSNAAAGEAGEALEAFLNLLKAQLLAANIVKKLRRQETGTRGARDPDWDELVKLLGKEIADVVIYGDLLMAHLNASLGEAVADKFNEVSEREGFPERIGPSK